MSIALAIILFGGAVALGLAGLFDALGPIARRLADLPRDPKPTSLEVRFEL